MIRDSGSGRHGEDSRSEAECEAPQSGPAKTGHRPASGANLTPSGVERSLYTSRRISHDEAREIAGRLINSHFHLEPHARIGIPARPDYDDDLLISAYIEQQAALALPSEPPSQGDVEGRARRKALLEAADIADSIDSGRGNEHVIAEAIRNLASKEDGRS